MENEIVTSSLHFGYARVSTNEQDLRMQIDCLKKAGCQRIYAEIVSSRRSLKERSKLDECLNNVRPGDTLSVWRLDRLGRSLSELVKIMSILQERQVTFQSLTENIETGSSTGKLTFHLFAMLAEFERNLISERTIAGLASARARGRVGGRKPKITEQMRREMLALYDSKKIYVVDICRQYKISPSAFYRAVLGRCYGNQKPRRNTPEVTLSHDPR